MLTFSINRRRQIERHPARATSAERRLDLGLDQRPRVQKKSAFGHIFTTAKEEITGIEVLGSQSERAQRLNRYGALGHTEPAVKRWLRRWMRGGGIALL